ncbi:MAG: hypothetical protein AAGA27_05475 [Pseudomonadota bacterium]
MTKLNDKRVTLKSLSWADVRNDIAKINPELAGIIDDISPNKQYRLYKASYPYGSYIVKQGYLQLPNNHGRTVPLSDDTLSKQIKSDLNYNDGSSPVSLTLNHTIEVSLTMPQRVLLPLSLGLLPIGWFFYTWVVLSDFKSLQPAFLWDVTAGARSIFMLPKISDARRHRSLCRYYKINPDCPASMLDHWSVFKGLANSPQQPSDWHTELIFFSGKWFEKFRDKTWRDLRYYMLDKDWGRSEAIRNQFIWDAVFSVMQIKDKLKPSPDILNTVKHLITVGVGRAPAFSPSTNDMAAPISHIQEAYKNVYKLKQYSPITMQPDIFKNKPVYYSLQFPTSMEFSLKSNDDSTILNDLYHVKLLLERCLDYLSSNTLNIASTELYCLGDKVNYDFFHSNTGGLSGIKPTEKIMEKDDRFLINGGDVFPTTSRFFQGCIRISNK